MPSQKGVGLSEYTPLKQAHFQRLVSILMKASLNIMQRHTWAMPFYTYLDLSAGPGRYADKAGLTVEGSPLIALLTARLLHLPLVAVFYEEDLATFGVLRNTLTPHFAQPPQRIPQAVYWTSTQEHPQQALLVYGDAQALVPELLAQWRLDAEQQDAKHLGLLYSDPNGLIPFAVLEEAARSLPQCDFLIQAGATTHKRQYYNDRNGLCSTFEEMLDTIKKQFWLIRDLYGAQHWTFLLGSNWKEMPRKLSGQGFHDLRSPEGQSIMRRANKRAKDQDGQGDLFTQGDL
jgi:hypothetical protein